MSATGVMSVAKMVQLAHGSEQMGFSYQYPDALTADQEQVLIGSLFGDGCLRERKPGATPYMVEHHAHAQVDYLIWKSEVFQGFRPKMGFSRGSQWRMLTGQAPV